MRILVICGAGASSTFVAQRLRRAAQSRGEQVDAVAGTEHSLHAGLDGADVVMVGPHLHASMPEIDQLAAEHGARAVLLPADVFGDLDGSRTLTLLDRALSPDDPSPPRPQDLSAEGDDERKPTWQK